MMTDLALPGITLVIGLPIALWLTSPGKRARRAARRWRRAVDETVMLVRPVLAGRPARLLAGLLPGPTATVVVVRAPSRGNSRTCTADATAARAGRAPGGRRAEPAGPLIYWPAGSGGRGQCGPDASGARAHHLHAGGRGRGDDAARPHTSTERVKHGLETAAGTGSSTTPHPCSSLPATCTVSWARPSGGRAVHGPQVDAAGELTPHSPAASAGRQTRTAS